MSEKIDDAKTTVICEIPRTCQTVLGDWMPDGAAVFFLSRSLFGGAALIGGIIGYCTALYRGTIQKPKRQLVSTFVGAFFLGSTCGPWLFKFYSGSVISSRLSLPLLPFGVILGITWHLFANFFTGAIQVIMKTGLTVMKELVEGEKK